MKSKILAGVLAILAGCEATKIETLTPWPFRPDQVTLSCEPFTVGDLTSRRVFVTTPDGRRYAANGSARAVAPLTTPIETDPDTSAVISRGLKLCADEAGPLVIRRPPQPASRPSPARTPSAVTVTKSILGPGITIQSDGSSEPAKLHISCDDGVASNLMFELEVRSPPAPLRGVFADFRLSRGSSSRVELSQGGVPFWMVRDRGGVAERTAVARVLRGSAVTVTLSPPWGSGRPMTWQTKAPIRVDGCAPPSTG